MSRTVRKILEDRRRLLTPEEGGARLEPFSDDHRIYPQGWSWAHIDRETTRRFQFKHDIERAQDWQWAVDDLKERDRIAPHHAEAAHRLADTLERASGGWRDQIGAGRSDPHAAFWDAEVSARVAGSAWQWTARSPDATEARMAVFDALFSWHQPTLAMIRVHGRPGGARYNVKHKPIRMNERETIERVCWCVETVFEFFRDRDLGYGRAA
jgi:hypothetical protein